MVEQNSRLLYFGTLHMNTARWNKKKTEQREAGNSDATPVSPLAWIPNDVRALGADEWISNI